VTELELICPHCHAVYRLPDGIAPRRRLRVRCPGCGLPFDVPAAVRSVRGTTAPEASGTPVTEATGRQDWPLRLADALLDDIVVYHPEVVERARRRVDGWILLADELAAAWRHWLPRVGDEVEDPAPLFRQAVSRCLGIVLPER